MIGTPCCGRQVTDLHPSSLLNRLPACQRHGVRLQVQMSGSDALVYARPPEYRAQFPEDRGRHAPAFVDADIGFEPEQVFRLMDFDATMTAAVYPAKRIDWEKAAAVAQPAAQASRAPAS